MLAVTSVLALAGFLFNQLSQHHFDELDRQVLADKLVASEQLLLGLSDLQRLEPVRPQLHALLGGHRDLAVLILDGEGRILFSMPKLSEVPETYQQLATQGEGEWRGDGQVLRGAAQVIERDSQRLSVLLMLDVTTHKVIFPCAGRLAVGGSDFFCRAQRIARLDAGQKRFATRARRDTGGGLGFGQIANRTHPYAKRAR